MFTARVQYALLILKEVKEKAPNPTRLKDVCEKYQLKKEFLIQTARKLRLSGYLRSIKGPGGGYVAADGLGEISLLKLYRDMQPDTNSLKITACEERAKYYIMGLHERFQLTLLDFKV